jgi:hypothetical protein
MHPMRKFALVCLAALIAFTTLAASYTPAQAGGYGFGYGHHQGYNRNYRPQPLYPQPRYFGNHRRHYHGGNAAGAALAAGLLGAIVVGAMAANAQPAYAQPVPNVPLYGAGPAQRCQFTRLYGYDASGRQIVRDVKTCR